MLSPRIPALIVLAAALLLSSAPVAVAEEGVTIDPGSPSGTEYQLPLQRAREEAAGSGSSDLSQSSSGSTQSGSASSTPSEAPLFGVGIVKRTKADRTTAAKRSRAPNASRRATQVDGAKPHLSTARAEQLAAAGGSEGGATLTLLSGAAMVVVLGGLAGVILRGRRSGL